MSEQRDPTLMVLKVVIFVPWMLGCVGMWVWNTIRRIPREDW
jgi:hypothetical protein